MQTLLSKALVASVTVAGLGLAVAPQADAFVLGGFGVNGTVNLTPPTAPPAAPFTISANFVTAFLDATSGPFASVDPTTFSTANLVPDPVTFTRTATTPFALYQLNPFSINLTGVPGFAGGYTLSVTPTSDSFIRVANSISSSVSNVITLTAVDNGGNTYSGSFALNDTASSDGTFSLSFTSDDVPEPLTMLGASAAVAFGAAFKRRKATKG